MKKHQPANKYLEAYIRDLSGRVNVESNSLKNGKKYRYESAHIKNIRSHCTRFLRLIGTPVTEIDSKTVENYCKSVQTRRIGDHYKYFLITAARKFVEWLHREGDLSSDFADHWDIPLQPRAVVRDIPFRRIPDHLIDQLRTQGDTARDRGLMGMIFNGFRLSEISHLSWTGFGFDYFNPLPIKNGREMMDGRDFYARRKRGEWWPCIVEVTTWHALKEIWEIDGRPQPMDDHLPRFGDDVPWAVFKNDQGGKLSVQAIRKVYYKYRDRVFCQPEFRAIRKALPPHAIRHIWIQRLNDLFPEQIKFLAPIGGWVPGSKVFLNYLNLRNNAARSFGKQIGGVDIFSAA